MAPKEEALEAQVRPIAMVQVAHGIGVLAGKRLRAFPKAFSDGNLLEVCARHWRNDVKFTSIPKRESTKSARR